MQSAREHSNHAQLLEPLLTPFLPVQRPLCVPQIKLWQRCLERTMYRCTYVSPTRQRTICIGRPLATSKFCNCCTCNMHLKHISSNGMLCHTWFLICKGFCEQKCKTCGLDCSVNDVEEKYYADGEDAYDMRKPFKDVKSKPALLPKGSSNQKAKDTKPHSTNNQASTATQESSDAQPAAEAVTEAVNGGRQDIAQKAAATSAASSEAKTSKTTKTARGKKR